MIQVLMCHTDQLLALIAYYGWVLKFYVDSLA